MVLLRVLVLVASSIVGCKTFAPTPNHVGINRHQSLHTSLPAIASNDADGSLDDSLSQRRRFLISSLFSVAAPLVVLGSPGSSCIAAAATEEEPAKTVYLSGKPPKIPGQKPKDKNDTTGTRKDPNFLRSISTCKSQCENGTGSDGYARSKEDCLSECQDICCTTYEQCTFAIVPRI